MLQIQIRITGNKEVIRKMNALDNGMVNLEPAFRAIGERAADYYANIAFLSQGGVFGSTWQALSPRYAAIKAKKYPGRPILVRTGKMMSGFRYRAGRQEVLVTNRMPYFKYHQSTLPRKKIPRRATMGINAVIVRIVRDEIKKEIASRLKKA